VERFSANRGTADGLRRWCRLCMSAWTKQYRNQPGNRERERERRRQRRAARRAAAP
jgi:hypothetical protein